MFLPTPLFGGLFLGWALGANDSANVFGTAVAARIITYRNAVLLCGAAAMVGALLQGEAGIHTYRDLAEQDLSTVLITTISAAITVSLMTVFSLPISTSQAVVGAIAGIGLATNSMNWSGLEKVVICWIATPIGGMLLALLFYAALASLFRLVPMSILSRDKLLWSGLLIVGVYGSYALGANNVANATGVFSGMFDAQGITDAHLALFGGAAIALGSITYSRRVMLRIGSGIMPLDAFTGLVAVSAMSVTVHVFALIGVPVSTSQAIVGAILGIGLIRGAQGLKFGSLRTITFGWFLTPVVSLILASAGYAIFCL